MQTVRSYRAVLHQTLQFLHSLRSLSGRPNSFSSSVCVTTATDVRLLATSDVSSWCVGVMRHRVHCAAGYVVTSSPACVCVCDVRVLTTAAAAGC